MAYDWAKFHSVFVQNMERRSRTIRGELPSTPVSPLKPVYRIGGDDLKRTLQARATLLAECIFNVRELVEKPYLLRNLSDLWYEILTDPPLTENSEMARHHEELLNRRLKRLRRYTDDHRYPSAMDPRYRIWNVSYADQNPSPLEIENWMVIFFSELSHKICSFLERPATGTLAELLAFADFELDRIIHPWRDNCGRHATAMVMWLAHAANLNVLPLFLSHEKHYASMTTLQKHTEYYRSILKNQE